MRQVSTGGTAAATNEYSKLPGLVDVHVHLREPGFLYKETIRTGTMAAAAGGFTAVCAMPNLNPCPDSPEHLKIQMDAIQRDAVIPVFPYAAITEGENGTRLTPMDRLSSAIAFTDDGRGVMSDELMEQAMRTARRLGKLIVAHCEDENYPRESSQAEWMQLKRDLKLVARTGCSYHMCHASTKESVDLIRKAKAAGLDVTCETAPHYLILTDEDVRKAIETDPHPGRFKMNPPIKAAGDREALIEGIRDGTIDMIATDHAPHSAAEKTGPYQDCAYGIVGLETAFAVLYTNLVVRNIISLDKLIGLMSTAPASRFGIAQDPDSTFALWDLDDEYEIDPAAFRSKGLSTPFAGQIVRGRCLKTVVDNKEVFTIE